MGAHPACIGTCMYCIWRNCQVLPAEAGAPRHLRKFPAPPDSDPCGPNKLVYRLRYRLSQLNLAAWYSTVHGCLPGVAGNIRPEQAAVGRGKTTCLRLTVSVMMLRSWLWQHMAACVSSASRGVALLRQVTCHTHYTMGLQAVPAHKWTAAPAGSHAVYMGLQERCACQPSATDHRLQHSR